MTRQNESIRTKHLLLSIVFFILALNAIALIYILADSKGIFSRMASARLARMLDTQESRQEPESQRLPSPGVATESVQPQATVAQQALPKPTPASRALTMMASSSISATGACVAVENFKSDIQVKSAKALLSSSPLRDKSWIVSTPMPAMYLAGVQTETAAGARKIAKSLADMGLAPLSMSANFVGLAKADSATSATELAVVSAEGLPGAKIVARQISPATNRQAIVALPQSRLETQFAASLPNRLPGVSLSAVPCPEAATALLAAK